MEEVRKGLGLTRFYLYGQSWGGMLAIEYALKYPAELKGLVISNMTASIPSYEAYAKTLRAALPAEARAVMDKYEARADYGAPEYQAAVFTHVYARHLCRLDPWPRILRRALAAWLVGPIEHIGSTAIPGLAAKAVIDIMAGVETLDASRPAIAPLADLGYCYFPYRADSEHWFCKPSPAFRTHHLHLIPLVSPQWREAIAFRDYLRSHSQIAAEYADLKRLLAHEHRLDREAYTDAKGPFIARVTELALQER